MGKDNTSHGRDQHNLELKRLVASLRGIQREIVLRVLDLMHENLSSVTSEQCRLRSVPAGNVDDMQSQLVVCVIDKLIHRDWKGPKDDAEINDPRAWLCSQFHSTAKQCFADFARFLQRQKRDDSANVPLQFEIETAHIAFRTTIAVLKELSDELALNFPRQFAVYYLHFECGFTAAEIAKLLGLTLASVNDDRLFARTYIRSRLDERS